LYVVKTSVFKSWTALRTHFTLMWSWRNRSVFLIRSVRLGKSAVTGAAASSVWKEWIPLANLV